MHASGTHLLFRIGVLLKAVDAAYPLSGEDGPVRGVPYVTRAIAWAALNGCPCVDTTDGRCDDRYAQRRRFEKSDGMSLRA